MLLEKRTGLKMYKFQMVVQYKKDRGKIKMPAKNEDAKA